ncbi:hypothetical protein T03_285 [Trichinella britovi]|uniref:Uncharacterized protein n=1 Tax=Trichinella britovi TaxID=45882 RepID=A0A0V1D9G9_TRIBR|nr:hypothetical protein T03_285 [Trichinella britovi]
MAKRRRDRASEGEPAKSDNGRTGADPVTQFAWLYGHGKKALSERRTNNKAMPNYVALLEKELCLKDRGCHQSAVFH